MRALLLAAILALSPALAGCAHRGEPATAASVLLTKILGTITDPALRPIAGANVTIQGENASTLSDASGAFALDVVPAEYLLLASAPGYLAQALRASPAPGAPAHVAFVLSPIPLVVPFSVVQEGRGLLSCEASVANGNATQRVACGAQDPNQRTRVDFIVNDTSDVQGAVVELVWDATGAGSRSLEMTVSLGEGKSDVELGHAEGPGHVSIALPARIVGPLLASASAGPLHADVATTGSVADEESALNAGLALQQPFTVYLSVFYHKGPPAGYTVVKS